MKNGFDRFVSVILTAVVVATLAATRPAASNIEPGLSNTVFMPFVTGSGNSEPPPLTIGNIQIVTIFFNGVKGNTEPDEYVEIRNDDSQPIQMQGWTLVDNQDHWFTFPSYVMQPGEVCRVYTNEVHPESCGFNYINDAAIWNNGGDCGYLRDQSGVVKSQFCY